VANYNQNSTSYTHSFEPNTTQLTMAMDYNAAGQPVIRVAGSEAFGNINIALGNVTGMTQVFKSGYNPNFVNGSPETFWDGSNLYPWNAWSTTGTLSCVSTGADTGDLTIEGLDANFEAQTDTITLTGTSAVTTTTSWARINKMVYADGSTNAGDITASRGGTVVGQITTGFGTSQNANYTVPAGYTAFVFQGQANVGKGNDGTGYFKYRPYNSTWQIALVFLLYQSVFEHKFTTPFVLPEKTDVDVQLTASNSGTAASCQYDMILIDNDYLPS